MKNEMITIQFYLNKDAEITSDHDYTIIDYLYNEASNIYTYIAEVTIESDKINELIIEDKDYSGFCTEYKIDQLTSFTDGNEIKYFVSVWNPIN